MAIFLLLLMMGVCALGIIGATVLVIYKIVTAQKSTGQKSATSNLPGTVKGTPQAVPLRTPSPAFGIDSNTSFSTNHLTEICARFSCQDYYVGKLIPTHKLANAMRKYPPPDGGNIIALIDTTVFGSAKTGLAISETGISWCNLTVKTARTSLRWSEFAKLAVQEFDRYTIMLGRGNLFTTAGGRVSQSYLQNLLTTILKEHKLATQPSSEKITSAPRDNNDVLDANAASFDLLLTLPGIGVPEARMILDRRAVQPFTSLDELAVFLNLKPHKVEHLRQKLFFSNQSTLMGGTPPITPASTPAPNHASSEAAQFRGRIID